MKDEGVTLSVPVSKQKSQELEFHCEKNFKDSHEWSLTRWKF
jgi:hypothetical protein